MAGFRLRLLLLVALAVPLGAGCAPKRAYYWGDYDSTLYSYYQMAFAITLLLVGLAACWLLRHF